MFTELLNFLMQVAKSYVKANIYIFNKWECYFITEILFPNQIYFVGTSLGTFCFALKYTNKINLSCDPIT